MEPVSLKDAVERASARAEVLEAVRGVYSDLGAAIELRKPRCDISGRCCRFEEFGHRLYVTTMELAVFVGQFKEQGGVGLPAKDWDGKGCPFQRNKLCGVHSIRPFGCRIFFCDPTAQQWQEEQYQRMHTRLKGEHERLAVPYFYAEWRTALRELGLA